MSKNHNTKSGRGSANLLTIAVLLLMAAVWLIGCTCEPKTNPEGDAHTQMGEKQVDGSDILTEDFTKIVFSPHWLPQAQFAGFYVAKEMGFYAAKGIDLEIIHPTASINNLQYLMDGKADVISSFLISALNQKQLGVDLVNIAQLSQHSAIMLVAKKGSGIDKAADLDGKRVGIWLSGFQETPMAFMREKNINIDWVPILSSVNLFLLGGLDAMTVMWYNEYHQIYLSGIDHEEMNSFFMSDYGFNIPEDGLYVLNETYSNRGNDLSRFVEATLQGWDYAAANRDFTVDLVVRLMKESNIPANRTHQLWMLDKILEVHDFKRKGVPRTYLEENDFDLALRVMKRHHHTEKNILYEEFFRPVISVQP